MKNEPLYARYITDTCTGAERVERPDVSTAPRLQPYGYRNFRGSGAEEESRHGFRVIDPVAADVIRRIFQMYSDGWSPKQIAATLNAEGVPGQRGSHWRDTVIRGHIGRWTGILNNLLYIGEVTIIGHRERVYVPGLRIVSDELWRRVKERQDALLGQVLGATFPRGKQR